MSVVDVGTKALPSAVGAGLADAAGSAGAGDLPVVVVEERLSRGVGRRLVVDLARLLAWRRGG